MKHIYNLNIFSLYFLLFFSSKFFSTHKYLNLTLNIVGFPSKEELSSINIENLLVKLSNVRMQTQITLGSNKQVLPCDISFEHYPLYVSSIIYE